MVGAFDRWQDQPPGRIPSAFHFGLVSCFFSSDFPQKSLGVWEAEIGTGRASFRRAETFLGPATSPRMARFVPRLRGMGIANKNAADAINRHRGEAREVIENFREGLSPAQQQQVLTFLKTL